MTIHWLGLGLSSYAGVRELARGSHPLVLWARDPAKAAATLAGLGLASGAGRSARDLRHFTLEALAAALAPGDVAVSMFPAPMHASIARVCIDRGAYLVTTSYISDAMRALDADARAAGVTLLNEVGLDPGLDHWMAHELFDRARAGFDDPRAASYSFVSVCGGFPDEPGEFRYRFSWSPAGVLRALRNPAQWIEAGEVRRSSAPGREARAFSLGADMLEMYPNRDSLAYVREYAPGITLPARRFVRGTLRPAGWAQAWAGLLERLPHLSEAAVDDVARDLWARHAYADGEKDRVVLHCALTTEDASGRTLWSDALTLDERGALPYGSAMNRLVSLPAVVGVREILAGALKPGVQAMPAEPEARARWLRALRGLRIDVREVALAGTRHGAGRADA